MVGVMQKRARGVPPERKLEGVLPKQVDKLAPSQFSLKEDTKPDAPGECQRPACFPGKAVEPCPAATWVSLS